MCIIIIIIIIIISYAFMIIFFSNQVLSSSFTGYVCFYILKIFLKKFNFL